MNAPRVASHYPSDMARILMLQCELEHRHQAPHLAMCLFASDLRALGHTVQAAMVHPTALDAVADAFPDIDLVMIDSIFPFAMVRRLRSLLGSPVLVGGHSALQHMLRGDADFALVGAARRLLPAAVRTCIEGTRPLPAGLWARGDDGVLDAGPTPPAASPGGEVLPYTPDFDWGYLGPPRAPGSNLRIPSVVAELGCVYDTPVLGTDDEGFYADTSSRLPDVPVTPAAREDLQRRFVSRDGGCTFCVFRYQPFRRAAPADTPALLQMQLEALRALGALGFSLQTENPAAYLDTVLPLASRLGFEEVHIRTIPWLLLKRADAFEAAAARAGALGIDLVLGQVGFEAFDALGLEVFHKGISTQDNRAAARLLTRLTAEHPRFEGTRGHGFIPLHPWTRPTDLRENLDACKADAPWLLHNFDPRRRLEIYNEWSPLFWKAQDDGLVEPAPDRFGWGFKFADGGTGEVAAVAAALALESATPAWRVLDRVLGVFEREQDPGPRKSAYLALRRDLAVSPAGPARGGAD